MSLRDRLAAETAKPTFAPRCAMAKLFTQLSKDDRAALDEALADVNIRHSSIEAALRESGFPVARDSVSRHRRGVCRCERLG